MREFLHVLRVFILGLLVSTPHPTNGANILFFAAAGTYSHRITMWPVVEALVSKGHQVTFLSGFENKNPNNKVQELVVPPKEANEMPDFFTMRINLGPTLISFMGQVIIANLLPIVCEEALSSPQVQKWINTTEKVDLVIVDAVFNECAFGLAHKFNSQVMVFGTATPFEFWPDEFGYPEENNWIPNVLMSQNIPLSFFGRVAAILYTQLCLFTRNFIYFPKIERILKEKLDMPQMPPILDLIGNTSLVLMNTHFSEELPRSLPPMFIPVGGMHVQEKDKLEPIPKELGDFIESAPNGFFLVSFGTEAKIHNAPEELRNKFFNAFRKLKDMRFLWKWSAPRPKEIPDNVLTTKWVPQQSVLAHPKIKGFISHGGLLSMQEAIYHKVPMITFPVFADQDYNAERLHRTKRGIRLELVSLTEDDIVNSVNAIITDSTYKRNVEIASAMTKDRPQHPIDTSVWWIEYILRHKGNAKEVLRSGIAAKQYWFQRRSLDVWAFIFGVILAWAAIVLFAITKLIVNRFLWTRSTNTKKLKKK